MNDHLNWRYATKKFDPSRKIAKPVFDELLEVLRLAPSSFGLQPWKFIVVHNPELRKELRLNARNQAQVTDADALIVFCGMTKMDEGNIKRFIESIVKTRGVAKESLAVYEQHMVDFFKSKNVEAISQWIKDQVYIALGFFLAECAHRKIDACPMEGFDARKFDEILELSKEDLESVVLCPVGYRAADDKYAQLKKVRYSKNELFIDR